MHVCHVHKARSNQSAPLIQSHLDLNTGSVIHVYYFMSGRAVLQNIRFKAGSIGPTVGRANTEAENQIFSCTARPKECDKNIIFII